MSESIFPHFVLRFVTNGKVEFVPIKATYVSGFDFMEPKALLNTNVNIFSDDTSYSGLLTHLCNSYEAAMVKIGELSILQKSRVSVEADDLKDRLLLVHSKRIEVLEKSVASLVQEMDVLKMKVSLHEKCINKTCNYELKVSFSMYINVQLYCCLCFFSIF